MNALPHQATLTITSLLSIVLMACHLTDDIVRGIAPGGLSNVVAVLILVVWLYGTLVVAERRGTSSCSSRRSAEQASLSST